MLSERSEANRPYTKLTGDLKKAVISSDFSCALRTYL
jgi:hypothetical protein